LVDAESPKMTFQQEGWNPDRHGFSVREAHVSLIDNHWPRASMTSTRLPFQEISLLNLAGEAVSLRDYFENRLLIILLRHLA
jgi:hypothetical protein